MERCRALIQRPAIISMTQSATSIRSQRSTKLAGTKFSRAMPARYTRAWTPCPSAAATRTNSLKTDSEKETMNEKNDLSDIRRDVDRVAPETVHEASAFATSILADVAGRRGALDGRIAPLSPS